MRKSSYIILNFVCASLSAFFLLGTIWIWRGEFTEIKRQQKANDIQDIVDIKDIETEKKSSNLEIEKLSATTSEIAIPTTIVKLPFKINLNVPFTSQAPEKDWSEPWQNLCEEAAILMLDAYYEGYNLSPLFAKDELLRMWDWEQKQGWGKSIEMEKIAKVVDEYFSNSKVKTQKSKLVIDPTIEQIKQFIASGKPVLAVVYGKILPNPYFRNGGPEYHTLIIRGYTETKFITNDPGSGWSKNYAYEYDVLMNAIHDWNGGDVKNGRKVVLVIE